MGNDFNTPEEVKEYLIKDQLNKVMYTPQEDETFIVGFNGRNFYNFWHNKDESIGPCNWKFDHLSEIRKYEMTALDKIAWHPELFKDQKVEVPFQKASEFFQEGMRNSGHIMNEQYLSRKIEPVNYGEQEVKALATQVGGNHYKELVIQPIEYTMKNNLNFCQGNVIKYVTRYKSKNGIEDLKKARHYIDLLIQLEYGGDNG